MQTVLNDVEVRVLGSLIEKQVTTPEYYPLTLNSLMLACNQKNNRHPVTSFDETTVAEAVESLREKNLAYVHYGSTSRVPKYKHVMPEVLHLTHPELAAMCVLMLRGSLTIGELRGSAARLYEFSSLEEAEATLSTLISREPEPLVTRLPRQPGQKEARFAHLLSGAVSAEAEPAPRSRPAGQNERERIENLEAQVAALKTDMEGLKQQLEEFRRQFE